MSVEGEIEKGEHEVEHPGHGHDEHEGKGAKGKEAIAGDSAKSKKRREYLIIIATLVGVVLTFILYERSKNAASSSTTPTQTAAGTVAGQATDPTAESGVQGLAQAFNAQASQEQSDYANTQAAQSGLSALLASLGSEVTGLQSQVNGLPAAYGGGTTPGQPPTSEAGSIPPLSAALQQQLASNGETIIKAVQDTAGGFLYLTSKGGIYNEGGSPFYGSYLSLQPNQQTQSGAPVDLTAGPGGSYTEVYGTGSTYTFGPGPGQNYAGGTTPQGAPIA
jgi:hypothetical protein